MGTSRAMSEGLRGGERDDDRVILGRAAQYGLRLVQRPVDNGTLVYEWQWIDAGETSPSFASRRLALEYISSFLDGPTPSGGLVLPPVPPSGRVTRHDDAVESPDAG